MKSYDSATLVNDLSKLLRHNLKKKRQFDVQKLHIILWYYLGSALFHARTKDKRDVKVS